LTGPLATLLFRDNYQVQEFCNQRDNGIRLGSQESIFRCKFSSNLLGLIALMVLSPSCDVYLFNWIVCFKIPY